MIASLFGEVITKELNSIIIDVNGVGYGVYVSISEQSELTKGQKHRLYIHESIREDSHDLYGFNSEKSKKLFELLISVKNVGPKAGLAILSVGSSDQIRQAIASGDIKLLMSAKGVGRKAAEQLVVELRDKVGLMATTVAEEIVIRGGIDLNDEALQALVSLGYSEQDASLALKDIDKSLPVDERLRLALKGGEK
jgi:Holliday junction DNA helicase RuvA